ncbi:MAG: arginine--tRNA ligase [Thermodesulfobacteriota bacterium]
MKEEIERVVLRSVESIGKKINLTDLPVEVEVDIPKRKEFGDFSINTAMVLARKMGKNPRQVAELIIENLPGEKDKLFRKVEIAGAGFINFFVREDAIVNKLEDIARLGEKFGASGFGSGHSVLVEFVSANPTGFLHMGHARNAVVGDTISNILSASGYRVTREFYINDAGRQMQLLGESVFARYRELFGEAAEIPEDGYKGDYVKEIASEIKELEGYSLLNKPREESLAFSREFARERLLAAVGNDLEDIGVRFDVWYSEKENIHGLGKNGGAPDKLGEIKKRLADGGALEERDGALWFSATKYGDTQDWVLVKSDGSPTYFLSDIAYHADKLERGFESLINVWGADHHGHVSRLRAALRALGFDDKRFNVVLIQFVRLMRRGEEVSMSKRAGSYVTMRDVVKEVGADVMRFFLLMRSSESHLDFDLDLARKESSENPVYYIQYAYARIRSLFRKAEEEGASESASSLHLLSRPEEVDLVKKLLLYPDIVKDSAESLAPHKVAYYLQELASDFHGYYNKFRIVDDDRDLSGARLYLVRCVQTVLSNGLKLLGISAPERM